MNPFQRLRKTIQSVNLHYEYSQAEAEAQLKQTTNCQTSSRNTQLPSHSGSNDELLRIKQICESQQLSSIKQLNQLAAKVEQLEKSQKRSQGVIESQVHEIVDLQKQNELLKANLNQHYSSSVQGDEKERKYKEEIHRINVTINELAGEIQAERNGKRQLLKEIETLKGTHAYKHKQSSAYLQAVEKQRMQVTSELEERISMYEYNVKKCSEDRKEFKLALAATQANHQKVVDACKDQTSNLKQGLLQVKKALEIESIRKTNTQQTLDQEREDFKETKQNNRKLIEELNQLRQTHGKYQKSNEQLQRNLSSLGSELASQKKNLKVKVIQVRDQTVNLQLQMYKRQCKDLMQEKLIMKSLNGYPMKGKTFQPDFRIANSQQSGSVWQGG